MAEDLNQILSLADHKSPQTMIITKCSSIINHTRKSKYGRLVSDLTWRGIMVRHIG